MGEQNPVALLCVSQTPDPVEAINGILRRAGEPVHCTWVAALRDLPEAIAQTPPQLLIHVGRAPDKLQAVIDTRNHIAAWLPLVVVTDSAVDEARIAEVMALGARDVVSLTCPPRLAAVILRELAAHRVERALEAATKSASDARSHLDTLLQRSNDAMAQVQEGILVEANRTWLELLRVTDTVIGEPVMDLFEEQTQPALRTALTACLQGRATERTVNAHAVRGDGSPLPLELVLVRGEHDGEPCVRLVVPARGSEHSPRDAAQADLLHRRDLLHSLSERIARPVPGGIRCVALIAIHRFEMIEREAGVTASEDLMAEIAMILKETLHPKEIAGRFADAHLLVLLERGNEHDVEMWAQQVATRVRKHVVHIGEQPLTLTCTIGLALATAGQTLDAMLGLARERCAIHPDRGAPQQTAPDPEQEAPAAEAAPPARIRADDRAWVKQIRAALVENRFRLVQQPIASLQGEPADMFDVLLRMVGRDGREILPSEFMPVAERNDLARNIDRWVIGASLSFAAQRRPGCLFVRLARDTVQDATFLPWLDNHLRARRTQPQLDRLCFQVTEEVAASHLDEVQALSAALRERGFRFALEAFGSRADSADLLEHVPVDFVKIDGGLIQGLAGDADLQEHLRILIEQAAQRQIQTIGERVEDSDTVTLLWQAGLHYIQGYFVNEPQDEAQRAES